MSTQIQLRRGTTAQHAAFTGAAGEVTVDTTKNTVVVHDGSTAGGHPLFKAAGGTVAGNVTITGDLTVQGMSFQVHSEITAQDRMVILNSGETGAGVTGGQSGIEIDRGTETNFLAVYDETTGAMLLGPIGATQPVALRTATPTDGALARWNDTNQSFDTLLPKENIIVAVGDEETAIETGTAKVTFRMPYALTLTGVRASLTTASTSGGVTVDVNENGTSIFGANKLSIDQGEKTSTTAATAADLTDTALADDAEITIDIDAAGTDAAGLKVTLIGRAS